MTSYKFGSITLVVEDVPFYRTKIYHFSELIFSIPDHEMAFDIVNDKYCADSTMRMLTPMLVKMYKVWQKYGNSNEVYNQYKNAPRFTTYLGHDSEIIQIGNKLQLHLMSGHRLYRVHYGSYSVLSHTAIDSSFAHSTSRSTLYIAWLLLDFSERAEI